ncbi:Gfo/Idh/MocA family protein [Winogradskyella sp. PE311]|uniref:Gfo/Idh/MocA family protein n=1 Tax=Winogradskyella sp. PE311 TaxID=3366943 RepID=UPI0039810C6F
MNTINWGIIGCGDVTEVKSGPAFNKVEHSRLVAVMRRNTEKAKDYAERHKVSLWYDNADDLLNNEAINAIYIATPPSSHLEYALKALKLNKNVYLEKPMALNANEAKQICQVLKSSNAKLTVAHYRRQLPMFLKVKQLIDDGEIGEIRCADIQLLQPLKTDMITVTEDNWRANKSISGGGYFHDLAPHQLDLIYYFLGDYKEAHGFAINQSKTYDADDVVNGIIELKNGIQCRGLWAFNVNNSSNKDELKIFGSLGEIKLSIFGNQIEITKNGTTELLNFKQIENIQHPMIEATVNYFLGKQDNPCSAHEGLRVMEIIDTFSS